MGENCPALQFFILSFPSPITPQVKWSSAMWLGLPTGAHRARATTRRYGMMKLAFGSALSASRTTSQSSVRWGCFCDRPAFVRSCCQQECCVGFLGDKESDPRLSPQCPRIPSWRGLWLEIESVALLTNCFSIDLTSLLWLHYGF